MTPFDLFLYVLAVIGGLIIAPVIIIVVFALVAGCIALIIERMDSR